VLFKVLEELIKLTFDQHFLKKQFSKKCRSTSTCISDLINKVQTLKAEGFQVVATYKRLSTVLI